MKFRRERVLFSLVALTVPNDPNQTLAFMVGHGRSLHLKKLQYSIKPLVENSNTKQISDDQEFDPLLLLSTETGSGGKEILEDDSREAKIITSSPSKTKVISGQEPRPFPFSLIVDQQEIKHALLLAAVNPNSIGVLISGGRGTAKSVLARSMEKIVPQVCAFIISLYRWTALLFIRVFLWRSTLNVLRVVSTTLIQRGSMVLIPC